MPSAMYASARYRVAARRYRRWSRYGRMPAWQKLVLAAVAVAVLAGGTARTVAKGTPAPAPQNGQQVTAAVAYARDRLGCPYLWGGTGPCAAGYDCSGLVMRAYASAGVTIPRTSQAQWAALRHVSSPHRGDLVFFAGADGTPAAPGHVGIVIRPGLMIDAYGTGTLVRYDTYGSPGAAAGLQYPAGFARPVPLARTVSVTAGTAYTPATWARALLRGAGFSLTSCNLGAVTAWEAAEGGQWLNAARYNPLNDKRTEPGSKPAVGNVQAYTTWAQGLRATLATLGGPGYGRIRAALAAGNSAQAVANAVAASPWGTSPFTAGC